VDSFQGASRGHHTCIIYLQVDENGRQMERRASNADQKDSPFSNAASIGHANLHTAFLISMKFIGGWSFAYLRQGLGKPCPVDCNALPRKAGVVSFDETIFILSLVETISSQITFMLRGNIM
jgi:hypothetical protein